MATELATRPGAEMTAASLKGIEKAAILLVQIGEERASEIFRRHARELENGDVLVRAIEAKNVRFTETAEQS